MVAARPGVPFSATPFAGTRVGTPFGAVPFAGTRFPGARFHNAHFVGHHSLYRSGQNYGYSFGTPFGPYGYGSSDYNPYADPYAFASVYNSVADAPAYSGAAYDDASSYPGSDQSTGDTAAHVTIQVPADARSGSTGVDLATGPIRYLDSPSPVPGVATSIWFEVRWNENGKSVTPNTAGRRHAGPTSA